MSMQWGYCQALMRHRTTLTFLSVLPYGSCYDAACVVPQGSPLSKNVQSNQDATKEIGEDKQGEQRLIEDWLRTRSELTYTPS